MHRGHSLKTTRRPIDDDRWMGVGVFGTSTPLLLLLLVVEVLLGGSHRSRRRPFKLINGD